MPFDLGLQINSNKEDESATCRRDFGWIQPAKSEVDAAREEFQNIKMIKPTRKAVVPSNDAALMIAILDKELARKQHHESDEAQALFWEAVEAETDEQELELLHEVLDMDPGNLDAVMVMMQHWRIKVADEIEILRRLILLGEKRIGKRAFEEMRGEFWGFLETRPYMRARHQLALALQACDRHREANAEWAQMLELNPGDNQGVRYELLASYFTCREVEEAKELLQRYSNSREHSVVFAWGQVLADYLDGDLPGATKALQAARAYNPHAEGYASGKARMPRKLPQMYGIGTLEEAQCYAKRLRAMWKPYPEARKWLTS